MEAMGEVDLTEVAGLGLNPALHGLPGSKLQYTIVVPSPMLLLDKLVVVGAGVFIHFLFPHRFLNLYLVGHPVGDVCPKTFLLLCNLPSARSMPVTASPIPAAITVEVCSRRRDRVAAANAAKPTTATAATIIGIMPMTGICIGVAITAQSFRPLNQLQPRLFTHVCHSRGTLRCVVRPTVNRARGRPTVHCSLVVCTVHYGVQRKIISCIRLNIVSV